MSFLSDGIGWFSTALRDAAGELVTISRGTATTTDVVAVRLSHDAEELAAGPGGRIVTQTVDHVWTIAKAAYLIGGVAVKPMPADRITDAAGNVDEIMRAGTKPAVVDAAGGLEWVVSVKRIVDA